MSASISSPSNKAAEVVMRTTHRDHQFTGLLFLGTWLGQLWAPVHVSTVRDDVTLSHV